MRIGYNVSFVNKAKQFDETQLEVEEHFTVKEEQLELINLILSLKDELKIEEVLDIRQVDLEEGE